MTAAPKQNPEDSCRFHFEDKLQQHKLDLRPVSLATLQVNITKLCNQACLHCHVDASPRRRETMSDEVVAKCLEVLEANADMTTLDITGGAPELHPKFKDLVIAARKLGKHVMVRHNLTVTMDPHPITNEAMTYLPDFFAEQGVEVVSSLPYYQEYFTDKQRGKGVFGKSIDSMLWLNKVGFGVEGSGKIFNLVYNPVGAFLPAPQASLEAEYKRELKAKFGITFNNLFAITNMPIHRFKFQLKRTGGYEEYMEKLMAAFNPTAAQGVMCRSMLSVSYDGKLYDCDFNQALSISIEDGKPLTIFDFDHERLMARRIKFGEHCFGCTAGSGSSCGGNTTE